MQPLSRFRWNAVYSLASAIIRLGANALLFISLARFYGSTVFGQFTLAHTSFTLCYLVADFGMEQYIAIRVANGVEKLDSLVQLLFPFRVIFAILGFLLNIMIALVSNFDVDTVILMFIFSTGILLTAVTSFFIALFKGKEILKEETRITFSQNTFLFVAVAVLLFLQMPVWSIATAFTASKFIGLVNIVLRARKELGVSLRGTRLEQITPTIKAILPFGIHLLFGTLYFQLDILMLAYLRDEQEVGLYQAAMKLVMLILVLPDILTNAILPLLSRLYCENRDRWVQLARILSSTLLYLGILIALVLLIYAGQIVYGLYGLQQEFSATIPVLKVLSGVLLVRFAVEAYALMLTTSQNQFARMKIVVIVSLINFTLNAYAIPTFGILGAAGVSLITNTLAGVSYILVVWKTLRISLQYFINIRQMYVVIIGIIIAITMESIGGASLPIALICLFSFIFGSFFMGFSSSERPILLSLARRS